MQIDKVIVTNVSALKAKYGARFGKLEAEVRRLIKADGKRGLTTKVVALDDPKAMSALGGKAVKSRRSAAQNKKAIDAVYRALGPDYVMILGARDVVPHQDMTNPVYDEEDDDDRRAWGDLPYACDAPYSKKIADFRAPTRVVGRLPDLVGAKTPDYLVRLVSTASQYVSRPRVEYDGHLGISAAVWKASTALSLKNLFGAGAKLQNVPPKDAQWSKALLETRSHFINCHGSPADPKFYGQSGQSFPVSHLAAYIGGRVVEGTVVAAECCYGAELYNPALRGGQAGICNTYLGDRAYGFLGSSTIAYGPSSGNDLADLMCRYFFEAVLKGASLGRALLEARQRFVQQAGVLSPFELKTLAQFSLMGDPSVHPVQTPKGALTDTRTYRKAFAGASASASLRKLRRDRLGIAGAALEATIGAARSAPKKRPPAALRKLLERAGREAGIEPRRVMSFAAQRPRAPRSGKALVRARPAPETAFQVLMGSASAPGAQTAKKKAAHRRQVVALVAMVEDGALVRLTRYHSRGFVDAPPRKSRKEAVRKGLEERAPGRVPRHG